MVLLVSLLLPELEITCSSSCACDVPAHSYLYSWEGNPRWSRAYVSSNELFHYYKGLAEKYGISEFVRLNHEITSAVWNDEKGKWVIEIVDSINKNIIQDEADIFINGAGFLK